jgi:hypothetical protein
MVLVGKPKGKEILERSRLNGWEDNIKMYFKILDRMDKMYLVQSKENLRVFMSEVLNSVFP